MNSESLNTRPSRADVMIVHPPELSREVYVTVLSQEGYSTLAFDDVASARRWMRLPGRGAKVLILELLPLPDEAWALIDECRNEDSKIAMIILTSFVRPDRAHRRRAEASSVAAFVGKPCSLRQLVDVVARVMAGERGIEVIQYTEMA